MTSAGGGGCGFASFFQAGTGQDPYGYQQDLALRPALPEALLVPTGAGKTYAVLMAWLWRRRFAADPEQRQRTPRRLVLCLPMRVLVTQTVDVVTQCLSRLHILADEATDVQDGVSVHVIMGGEADDSWMRAPERDAVLIGTQDMLLSRALNRGYGVSRFRWPALFGLLNSDSLWVFDEVQLMGSGLYTSAQMDAFRSEFGTCGETKCIWMSATAEPEWLATVNRRTPAPGNVLRLGEEDAKCHLAKRLNARKTLRRASVTSTPSKKAEVVARYAVEVAGLVLDHHIRGSLTLVVVNTVERAAGIYQAVVKATPKAEVMLVHSRFRFVERESLEARLKCRVNPDGPGRIVVSTQVIEAGVDISAKTLITEIAPWSSLVQRWGRVNRAGEHNESSILWIDIPDDAALPYSPEDFAESRTALDGLEGKSVAPALLPKIAAQYQPRFAFRRRDFEELFDTTPDITGTDIDVSRFVRGQDDPDVRVFWRDWKDAKSLQDMPGPHRREICPAPISEVKSLAAKPVAERAIWRWDHVDGRWVKADLRDVFPGQTYLLHCTSGGYVSDRGWSPTSKDPVKDVRVEGTPQNDSVKNDGRNQAGKWISLQEHSEDVVKALSGIIDRLGPALPESILESLKTAALWHDVGKAYHVFQEAMRQHLSESDRSERASHLWAKRPKGDKRIEYSHPYFRHELASALVVLKNLHDPLAAYLVASHHGKVRGTIRSIPGEKPSEDGGRYALGIWEGEGISQVDLGDVVAPETTFSLECMGMGLSETGEPSWVDLVAGLLSRSDLGPFRLAYLESLLVAADWAASAKEGGDDADGSSENTE